jgi:hypothetical protein
MLFLLPSVSPEVLVLTSGTANLYHDVDQKTRAKKDIVIFSIPQTKETLIMSGYGPVFHQMIQTVHIALSLHSNYIRKGISVSPMMIFCPSCAPWCKSSL